MALLETSSYSLWILNLPWQWWTFCPVSYFTGACWGRSTLTVDFNPLSGKCQRADHREEKRFSFQQVPTQFQSSAAQKKKNSLCLFFQCIFHPHGVCLLGFLGSGLKVGLNWECSACVCVCVCGCVGVWVCVCVCVCSAVHLTTLIWSKLWWFTFGLKLFCRSDHVNVWSNVTIVL